MKCEEEIRRLIEAWDKLWDLGVNPWKAWRDLERLAEAGDPRLAEAFKAYMEFRRARNALLRCALRTYGGEE